MSNYLIQGETLTGIADAIRAKSGNSDAIKVSDFATQIEEIEGSGGGGGSSSLETGMYFKNTGINPPNKYQQWWFYLNNILYAFTLPYAGNGSDYTFYRYDNGTWTEVIAKKYYTAISSVIIFNNTAYFFCGYSSTTYYTWDGTSSALTEHTTGVSAAGSRESKFVQDGKLKICSYEDANVYVLDEATQTWTAEADLGSRCSFATVNNEVYAFRSSTLYKYENSALTEMLTLPRSGSSYIGNDKYLYILSLGSNGAHRVCRYNPADNTVVEMEYVPGNAQVVAWEYLGDQITLKMQSFKHSSYIYGCCYMYMYDVE